MARVAASQTWPDPAVSSYVSWSVKQVFAAASAFRRPDWAALSFARFRAPRNVGRAMAIRMPMIRTTIISSIRVKPSSSRTRFVRPLSICLRLLPFEQSAPPRCAFSRGVGAVDAHLKPKSGKAHAPSSQGRWRIT